jgi:hypothetical protein
MVVNQVSLRLAKMHSFHRLQFLPDTRLAKVVFLQSKAQFDASDLPIPAATRPASWCNKNFIILCDLNFQSWWLQDISPEAACSSSVQKIVKKCIYRLDEVEWRETLDAAPARPSASGFSARAHYQSFKTSYGAESYLSRGDRKSAMFRIYLRAGNFGLNARIVHDVSADSPLRCCRFCPDNQVEDEVSFIMSCTAYAFFRQILWLNLENSLLQDGLVNEWRCILHASAADKFQYLLGYFEPDWKPKCASSLDHFVRLYILSAAAKRKELMMYAHVSLL